MADGRAELTTFDLWLAELDELARTYGRPDRGPSQTGNAFWFEYYRDGLTPKQAMEEDAEYNP